MEVKTSLLDNMIGVGDMVLLEPLTEDSFIENLRNRFDRNEIYTYIGSVVISMNPYRSLPIFTSDKVEEYHNRNFYELSPHIGAFQEPVSHTADGHLSVGHRASTTTTTTTATSLPELKQKSCTLPISLRRLLGLQGCSLVYLT
ncbi:hypothetical protein CRUP_005110 [Coryphaenoides rupestris]|nr:hypothetical protein CRUP_005110 [Coryphaenoides rupestris]